MNTYSFSDLVEGQEASFEVKITDEVMRMYQSITGDNNLLHTSKEYAKKNNFLNKVVYGQLLQSYFSTLAGVYLPGKYSLIMEVHSKFRNPVYVEDIILVKGIIKQKINLGNMIKLKVSIYSKEKICVTGEMTIKVLK